MPQTIPISRLVPDRAVGLEIWMQTVFERAEKVRQEWDAGGVHDLRVALRRCRTMAEALSQVNPDPGWRRIKKSSKDLFHVLGDLRDTQVEREWVKKLAIPRDPPRVHLLRVLSRRERDEWEQARKALDNFSVKDWKKLSRKLEPKARLFPQESIVFQRLGLAKLDEAAALFGRARKTHSGAAWHRARIGLKHFRYVAENFMPRRFAPLSGGVKRVQDLLGEMHDFDVLRLDMRRNSAGLDETTVSALLDKVHAERKVRLAELVAKTSGSGSLLLTWQAAFEIAHPLTSARMLDRRSA